MIDGSLLMSVDAFEFLLGLECWDCDRFYT